MELDELYELKDKLSFYSENDKIEIDVRTIMLLVNTAIDKLEN